MNMLKSAILDSFKEDIREQIKNKLDINTPFGLLFYHLSESTKIIFDYLKELIQKIQTYFNKN